jgi:hypothetical protein
VKSTHAKGDCRPFLAVPVRDHSGRIRGVLRASDKLGHREFLEEDTIALLQLARSLANELDRPKATSTSLVTDIEKNWANPQTCIELILQRCGIVAEADRHVRNELHAPGSRAHRGDTLAFYRLRQGLLGTTRSPKQE